MAERYDCKECKESLYGRKYILREECPYCIDCFEILFSNKCEECEKIIGCSSKPAVWSLAMDHLQQTLESSGTTSPKILSNVSEDQLGGQTHQRQRSGGSQHDQHHHHNNAAPTSIDQPFLFACPTHVSSNRSCTPS